MSHFVCSLEPTDCFTPTLMFSGINSLALFADRRPLGLSLPGQMDKNIDTDAVFEQSADKTHPRALN